MMIIMVEMIKTANIHCCGQKVMVILQILLAIIADQQIKQKNSKLVVLFGPMANAINQIVLQ